jgi:hypothetical protein
MGWTVRAPCAGKGRPRRRNRIEKATTERGFLNVEIVVFDRGALSRHAALLPAVCQPEPFADFQPLSLLTYPSLRSFGNSPYSDGWCGYVVAFRWKPVWLAT